MSLLASPIVDWTAMWKIVVAVLVAGAGVVVLFGLMLLGLKFSQGKPTHGPGGTQSAGAEGTQSAGADGTQSAGTVGTPSGGARIGGFTLALVCGLLCAGIIAVGVYAMTQKPSSPAPTPPPKSALVAPAGSRMMLVASLR